VKEKPQIEVNSNSYLVWQLGEFDSLSNMLYAIAYYKRKMGQLWPREIIVHKYSRICLRAGSCTIVKGDTWVMLDGFYMSQYMPIVDKNDGKRYPTVFKGKRHPAGRAFRDRPLIGAIK
jgi:hypothetical protein